jgi:hypothetical protein
VKGLSEKSGSWKGAGTEVDRREKQHILTGGLILITVGILIILNKTTAFGFNKSWPVLLIVIGIGALAQRIRDLGGWFLLAAGVIFLANYNWELDTRILSAYLLPALLIVIGLVVLRKYFKGKS